jgi:hypothetical protein
MLSLCAYMFIKSPPLLKTVAAACPLNGYAASLYADTISILCSWSLLFAFYSHVTVTLKRPILCFPIERAACPPKTMGAAVIIIIAVDPKYLQKQKRNAGNKSVAAFLYQTQSRPHGFFYRDVSANAYLPRVLGASLQCREGLYLSLSFKFSFYAQLTSRNIKSVCTS